MGIPTPVRLFHITAIVNLPAIANAGQLLAKNAVAAAGLRYSNIAYQGAQSARARRPVPTPPGGLVHDYVPFYFTPRSPMLKAIDSGRVAGCPWRQPDIVHFETTVPSVVAANPDFVFYDRNATLMYANVFTNLKDLDKVAWDLITEPPQLDGFCKYWFSKSGDVRYGDRMERRQAEFLVKQYVPLHCCSRVGVLNQAMKTAVETVFRGASLHLPVDIMPAWYY